MLLLLLYLIFALGQIVKDYVVSWVAGGGKERRNIQHRPSSHYVLDTLLSAKT